MCAIQGYILEMSQILVSFEFLIHSTRASCNVRNPFNVVRFSLHGSEYTHPATCRSPPLPPKNAPNTHTEAHIKTRIMLTLNTPINQCECFLIMTVFQRWGKWISYICMQICCWSHDVNDASCYQLLQGDCWEQRFLAEDVGRWMLLRRTVTQTSLTVTRDKETAHVPDRHRFTLHFPLLLLLLFTSPSPPLIPGSWP